MMSNEHCDRLRAAEEAVRADQARQQADRDCIENCVTEHHQDCTRLTRILPGPLAA